MADRSETTFPGADDEPQKSVEATGEPIDEEFDRQSDPEELPGWLEDVTETARELPGGGERLAVWLPTLAAGWRAARRGLALASGLRHRVDGDESLQWPDELTDEFVETLEELRETMPQLDDALPAATEFVETLERKIATDVPTETIGRATERLERWVEVVLQRLLELAFFGDRTEGRATRNRHLRALFNRLEELFDRLVYLWLQDRRPGDEP